MCLRFIQNNEKDLYKCFTLRILKHVLHCLKLLLKKKNDFSIDFILSLLLILLAKSS